MISLFWMVKMIISQFWMLKLCEHVKIPPSNPPTPQARHATRVLRLPPQRRLQLFQAPIEVLLRQLQLSLAIRAQLLVTLRHLQGTAWGGIKMLGVHGPMM